MNIPMVSVLTTALVAIAGCAGGAPSADPSAATASIRVDPSAAQVAPGGTLSFHATVTGTAAQDVTWSSDCGSVTQAGAYTAPQTVGACRVTVKAAGGAIVGDAVVSVGGWAATCAAEPEPTANVVYACDCTNKGAAGGADSDCVAGNDAGAGTKSSPFQSWPKARAAFRSLPAGGTIALCKGGRWNVVDSGGWDAWTNVNCSAASPCTVRDYTPAWGSGDEAAPLLSLTAASDRHLFMMGSGTANVRVLNLHFLEESHGTSSVAKGVYGLFAYGATHDVEFCNTTFDGFGIAAYVTVTKAMPACDSDGWKFRGNRFLNACTDAMLMYSAHLDVDGNYFDNNGHNLCGSYAMESSFNARDGWPWGPTTHTVYFNGESCPIHGLTFRNNEVHRNAMYQGYVQGSAVKIRSQGDGILVDNNLVDMTPPHPAISGTVTAIGADDNGNSAGFDRMTIRRNRIPSGPGRKLSVSSASNLLIEDNLIWVTGNLLDHDEAIVAPHTPGNRPTVATIRNNTIYYAGSASGLEYFNAITVGGASAGSGQVLTGNSVTVAGGGGSCYRVAAPELMAFMDSNHCSGANTFATPDGHTGISLAAWRSTHPTFDAHSIMPPLTGLFVNAPTDLTPANGSPLVGAASTASTCTVSGLPNQPCSSPLALEGATWSPLGSGATRDAAPDIGALER